VGFVGKCPFNGRIYLHVYAISWYLRTPQPRQITYTECSTLSPHVVIVYHLQRIASASADSVDRAATEAAAESDGDEGEERRYPTCHVGMT